MGASLKREGDKVWIEGVPVLEWAQGKDTTFLGSLEAALAVTDRPYSYVDLMGYSGLASRMRWFRGDNGQRGSTSCFVGESMGPYRAIGRATGWHIEDKVSGLVETYQDESDMARFAPDIVATIEVEMPALVYEPNWNVAVLCGYADEGRRVLLVDYHSPGKILELNTADLIPFLLFIEDEGRPPSTRDALLEGLRVAVHNWNREPERSDYNIGHYVYGRPAFEMWQEDVRFWATSPEDPKDSGFDDWWTMMGFRDTRRAVAGFLRANAGLLGENAKVALDRAADLYEEELRMLRSDDLNGRNAPDFCWFLDEICKIESQAIDEIETALTEVGE